VSWQFEQKGYLGLPAEGADFDAVFLIAADAGADDVTLEDGYIEIYTPRDGLQAVQEALKDAGVTIDEARLEWVAKTPIDLDLDSGGKVVGVIEALEDLDDTQTVYSNLHMTDELVASLEAES
jgi:transcriptional/translational regulatory protein YebC/TACO1